MADKCKRNPKQANFHSSDLDSNSRYDDDAIWQDEGTLLISLTLEQYQNHPRWLYSWTSPSSIVCGCLTFPRPAEASTDHGRILSRVVVQCAVCNVHDIEADGALDRGIPRRIPQEHVTH